ncbi:MAG: hypothetical protein LBT95_09145 [Treponema sp.]|jgi:hypothetical protein|nr:hypothetical protein [Treponema sp.]
MSDMSNPYQSPQTESSPAAPLTAQGVLTEAMVFYLRGASPWIRFIGVLSYIGSGFMAAAGLAMIVVSPGLADSSSLFSSIGFNAGMGAVYIALGVIVFFPARFTYKFGAKIRSYLQSNAEQELELAFKNNKSLWKFYGILSIVYLAIIPVALVIGILIGFAVL